MSKLVLDHLGNALLGGSTADLLVQKEVHNSVCDKTPVLHGTLSEVRNGDLVHLGERELNAEDLLVESEGLGSKVEREAAVLNILSRRSIDANGDAEVVGLDVVELTDDEGDEVGGHEGRLVEGNGFLAILLSLGSNIHVAEAGQLLVGDESDGELGLQGRLVEAGECAASVGRLHLGDSQETLCAIGVVVGRPVETSHLVVELASELDLELGLGALADAIVELEGRDLGRLVVCNLGI